MKKILSLLMLSTLVTNVALSNDFLKNVQSKAEQYGSSMYNFFYNKASDSSQYQKNAYESATIGSYIWAAKNIFKYGMNKTAPKANQQTFGTIPNRLFGTSYRLSRVAFPVAMMTSLSFKAADVYNKKA